MLKIAKRSTIGTSGLFDSGLIITIFLTLKPVYAASSGGLQICDYFLLLSLAWLILVRRRIVIANSVMKPLKPLFILVVHICLVNGIWYLFDQAYTNYLRYSLYYIYNAVVFLLCHYIYRDLGRVAAKQALLNGALLSGLVAAVGLVVNYTTGRSSGMFNNPNQLGYYGVLLAAIAFYLGNGRYNLRIITILSIAVWCVISSLSKAAFIGMAFQFLLCMSWLGEKRSLNRMIKRALLILFLSIAFYILIFSDIIDIPLLKKLTNMGSRITRMSTESDSDFSTGRGYARIAEIGFHFLWGMGEGDFDRFEVMKGMEVHSTYASIIVSYGLIGSFFFVLFLATVMRKNGQFRKSVAILSGPLLYSLTHNGSRNTMLWMLLAFVYFDDFTDSVRSTDMAEHQVQTALR